mmetsp:Transcript_16779/g.63569  ORF Transcript_16779/g.63569 Transcript_16779/m.63569 type:complete len:212 (-) Transcript_16779:2927-3562(-)
MFILAGPTASKHREGCGDGIDSITRPKHSRNPTRSRNDLYCRYKSPTASPFAAHAAVVAAVARAQHNSSWCRAGNLNTDCSAQAGRTQGPALCVLQLRVTDRHLVGIHHVSQPLHISVKCRRSRNDPAENVDAKQARWFWVLIVCRGCHELANPNGHFRVSRGERTPPCPFACPPQRLVHAAQGRCLPDASQHLQLRHKVGKDPRNLKEKW